MKTRIANKINWSSYNKSLINRGNITLWFSPDVISSWYAKPTGKRGAQQIYADVAIKAILILKFRFGMTLREVQGFIISLLELIGVDIDVPNYTTICRRLQQIDTTTKKAMESKRNIHIVIDSTGLKVYGEGEWKVRQHGYAKRRTWRKLHLAVNESNSQIEAVVFTDNSFKDNEVFEDLVDGVNGGDINQISADGAYDTTNCYKKSKEEDIHLVTPPRKDAVISKQGNCPGPLDLRNQHIKAIKKYGEKNWKKKTGYHRRSISETAMFRFKTILGRRLSSRIFNSQANEAFIKCDILNKMPVPAALGF